MKRDALVLAIITFAFLTVYFGATFNFFAQDDFILINQFSQNDFLTDLKNVFSLPQVTHWRPVHNLYFLIAGNLFGRNYLAYHVLTFLLHVGTSFLIYKIVRRISASWETGLASGLIYGVHPAHFVSLFWISGGATTIGFSFLIASLYFFLNSKKFLTFSFYLLALLASEAMVFGLILFYCFKALKRKGQKFVDKFLIMVTVSSTIFLVIKLLLFTPKSTFAVYKIEFSAKVFSAIKYYLLRILGFSEVSKDYISSILVSGLLLILIILVSRHLLKRGITPQIVLPTIIIGAGLFPFILIPNHLSPHYMNTAIFGFSQLVAFMLKETGTFIRGSFLAIFIIAAILNINLAKNYHWVVTRSNLAKIYIEKIKVGNLPAGSTIVFDDNLVSSSEEAYIALGAGRAIDFWFRGANYHYCFTKFEICRKTERRHQLTKTSKLTKEKAAPFWNWRANN